MDLLLITDENKQHYIYINDFGRFKCNKTKKKIRIKNTFADIVYNVLVKKKVLIKHKRFCLNINGKQSVKLRSDSINLKNYFKQLAVPFKIYADFESILKRIHSNDKNNNPSYTKKYKAHISCRFAYKVVCIDDRFSKPVKK